VKDTQIERTRAWEPRLADLARRLREAARGALRSAVADGDLERMTRPVAQGAGDVTFGLDEAAERVLSAWLDERAREGPLSLMTEDAGWRHRGPGPGPGDRSGPPRDLDGFDHGGPRIAIDPIDGTRNLMADLRSAWTVISFCGPGPAQPRLADVDLGLVAEIPDSRAARWRALVAARGAGCRLRTGDLSTDELLDEERLEADDDDRADHAYFPFFSYMHDLRPPLAALQAGFFARLARHEGADVRSCYDDQYISNAGQLFLLARGTYRLIVDARQWAAERAGHPTVTSKPYDLAGAVLCAREAGCVVTSIEGDELDFPLDTSTPVGFVGFANRASHERMWPHLQRALAETSG